MNFLIVFVGAGIGGAMRHGVNVWGLRLAGPGFPYATLAVNVTGSLVMGLLAGWLALYGEAPQHWRLFLLTGVLGGFTTFSAFSLDAVLLWERGDLAACAFYVLVSVAASIASLVLGLWIVRSIA